MKSFMALIEAVNKAEELEDTLIGFFADNPNPDGSEVHDLADELGISPHDIETAIYKLLSGFFDSGRWNEKGRPNVDPDELEAGIDIEYEHTSNKKIAERITKDHLSEIKDYYTRLKKMESEAEKKITEAAEAAEDEKVELMTDEDGESVEKSVSDKEEDKEDTQKELNTDSQYVWNIESYTIMGIRQVLVYASEERISYDSYKATPYNMLMYVDKKYGKSKFGETLNHLNLGKEDNIFSDFELILDNDGLNKEVVDFIIDNAKEGFNMKVSVV